MKNIIELSPQEPEEEVIEFDYVFNEREGKWLTCSLSLGDFDKCYLVDGTKNGSSYIAWGKEDSEGTILFKGKLGGTKE